MAAIAYSPIGRLGVGEQYASSDRSGPHAGQRPRTTAPSRLERVNAILDLPQDLPVRTGRRVRFVPTLLCIGMLAATYFGAGALVSAHANPVVPLAHSQTAVGGYSYVVQPGDTIWSIAARLEPNADPRPLVDKLTSELGGSSIRAGEKIFIRVS